MKYIGIKLADGSFYPVLEKGRSDKNTIDLTTVKDNQTTVQIDLYGSESGTMDGAEYVDTLEIRQLEPHPNGEPELHLEVSLDKDDNLHAEVVDPETGKSSTTQIVISKALTERNTSDTTFAVDEPSAASNPSVTEGGGGPFDEAGSGSAHTDEAGFSDTFARDIAQLDIPSPEDVPDTFEQDIKSLSYDSDDGSASLSMDELSMLGKTTKLSLEGGMNSSDTEEEETMIGPSVNDETFSFDDSSSAPEVSDDFATDVKKSAAAFSADVEYTTDSITQALSKAEDELADTMSSIADTLNDMPSPDSPDADFPLPDSDGLEESPVADGIPDLPPLGEDKETPAFDDDFSLPDVGESGGAEAPQDSPDADFPLPDFDGLAESPVSDESPDLPPLGEDKETPAFDDDFSLPDVGESGGAEAPQDSPDADFPLPDFGGLAESPVSDESPDFPPLGEDKETPGFDDDFSLPDVGESGGADVPQDPFDDIDLPDLGEAAAVSRAAASSFDDEEFSMPDFGDTTSTTASDGGSTYAPSGGFDFDGLYDKETLEGGSGASGEDVAETVKKKTKVPMVICIICAIICILAALLVLFVIPSRVNLLTRESYKKKTQAAQEQISTTLSQLPEPLPSAGDETERLPEPEVSPPPVQIEPVPPEPEVITAQEDAIVVAENPASVVPDKPVASAEKAEDIRYKVKWGDTLWDIADAYYKNPWKYKSIAQYNGIRNPDYIVSGTWILIPAE